MDEIAKIGPAEAKTAISRPSRRSPKESGPHSPISHVADRLEREVEAMTLYALATGVGVPPDLLTDVDKALAEDPPPTDSSARMTALGTAHFALTKLLAPAKPGSVLLLVEQRRGHPYWQTFGAVPLVRTMQAIAVVSLLVLLGVSLSDRVNAVNMTKGLLNLFGYDLLCVEIFLVAAAAIGASLANLRRLDQYISNCTFEQRFEGSYWTRLVMGVISGIILSQVVYGALVGMSPDSTSMISEFGQPVLALLGGFSADLVHDILQRFIAVFGNVLGTKTPKAPPPPDKPPG